MKYQSIESIARRIHVPVNLIERAVDLGLAVPATTQTPYHFSDDEVTQWLNWDGVGRLIQQRLKRNDRGEYLGRFIEPGDYESKNQYILPFDGTWLVTDGGAARADNGWIRQNHYYMAPCIRWAWDFCVIHPDDYDKCYPGMSTSDLLALRFRKGQEENTPDFRMSEPWEEEEYRESIHPDSSDTRANYCYGLNIIAPADGIITTRMGAIDDPEFSNTVKRAQDTDSDEQFDFMISHRNGEYSQVAHVLAKSVKVVPGQEVKQGTLLCGAGGKAFMPHLHWGVWDSWHPLFAQALPSTISKCLVYQNGAFVKKENVWLERGILVKNNSAAPVADKQHQ